MHSKLYYKELQNRYFPKKLNLIFVFESPPVSGKYFYDESGKETEPLFKELMKLIGCNPSSKKDGLLCFRDKGYLLMDATYTPVNGLKGKARDDVIKRDLPILISDLKEMKFNDVPLVLVKINVCKLLENDLNLAGFNVLNKGLKIPFPSTGNQKRFHHEVKKLCFDWDG